MVQDRGPARTSESQSVEDRPRRAEEERWREVRLGREARRERRRAEPSGRNGEASRGVESGPHIAAEALGEQDERSPRQNRVREPEEREHIEEYRGSPSRRAAQYLRAFITGIYTNRAARDPVPRRRLPLGVTRSRSPASSSSS